MAKQIKRRCAIRVIEMAAPKENSFWKARSTHGRTPIYSDPEDLRDACYQYFQWVETNPLFETKPMIANGEIQDAHIPKMRAMTISSISRFVGMTLETWTKYKVKEGFSDIVKEAEEIVRDQKLIGAAAGFLNANIIARELGLKDSSAVDVKVPEGLVFVNNYGGAKDES